MPTMRETIDRLCERRIGRRPNLRNPTGYNDKIQWLKLHDQTRAHIQAHDKLEVRRLVEERAGAEFLVPLTHAAMREQDVKRWAPYVIKPTHDSGSACLVTDIPSWRESRVRIGKALDRVYGAEKGEWAYQFVQPRVIVEHALPQPIVDYKFHCTHGRVRWVQVIAERASGKAKETILAADGKVLPLHMDQNFRHAPDPTAYPGGAAWVRLLSLATTLAEGWRYVRVDLYWSRAPRTSGDEHRPYFGELTFWPLSGCYRTPDEPAFGGLLDIDLSYKHDPLVT